MEAYASYFVKRNCAMLFHVLKKTLALETFTDASTFRGTGSPMSSLSFDSKVCAGATERGTISGAEPKMSFPLSSLVLALDICLLLFVSASVSNVPLSSRCFATSGREVGFLGVMLPSVLNDIWLIPFIACWDAIAGNKTRINTLITLINFMVKLPSGPRKSYCVPDIPVCLFCCLDLHHWLLMWYLQHWPKIYHFRSFLSFYTLSTVSWVTYMEGYMWQDKKIRLKKWTIEVN